MTKELAAAPEQAELPVSIGRIQLSNGEVQFGFRQAELLGASHQSRGQRVGARRPRRVMEIAGRVEGTAPVDVRGSINPSREMWRSISRPRRPTSICRRLRPTRRSMRATASRRQAVAPGPLQDRRPQADGDESDVLDQLTFGQHMSTARRRPSFRPARGGAPEGRQRCDRLDLPIQGTLDDPQFMWGGSSRSSKTTRGDRCSPCSAHSRGSRRRARVREFARATRNCRRRPTPSCNRSRRR
jgi:hypothetical protein